MNTNKRNLIKSFILRSLLILAAGILTAQLPLYAQENSGRGEKIKREYRKIKLGMNSAKVKKLLKEDSWFNYRGEPDITMLERQGGSLIDAGGSLFIKRGLFQFEEDKLIAITLELNPETVDWYTVYTSLGNKYGEPADMSPERVWWEDKKTRLSLERPLTVKYLDMEYFNKIEQDKKDRQSWREDARKEFLDEF